MPLYLRWRDRDTKACEGWITDDPDDTPKGTCGLGTNIASLSGTCPTGPGRTTEAVGGYLSPLLLSCNPGSHELTQEVSGRPSGPLDEV